MDLMLALTPLIKSKLLSLILHLVVRVFRHIPVRHSTLEFRMLSVD